MSCPQVQPAPLRCPTRFEAIAAVLALLPRGRAWQTNDGGPMPQVDRAFATGAFASPAFSTEARDGSILWKFWAAFADVVLFAAQRLCALRLEFWCATQTETRDLWMQEYGLPDPCDAFPDLCAKVAAIGGSRCEYFAGIAARAGWSVTCEDALQICGDRAGCSLAGRARAGGGRAVTLRILVDLGASVAFGGRVQTPPIAGRQRAGRPLACGANIEPLRCVIERVAPAHVTLEYVTH